MPGSLKRLLELPFLWKVTPIRKDEKPDCMLVQAFGQELTENGEVMPGPCNEALAKAMVEYNKGLPFKGLPVITQWEIAETEVAYKLNIVKEIGSRGHYLDTQEVLGQAAEFMKEKGWTRAIVVGHPLHLYRCIWIAEKQGVRVVEPKAFLEALDSIAHVWNSRVQVPERQWQTTSFWKWSIYELLARILFWAKGQI